MSLNYRTSIATMTDSLLAPGREVLYKRYPSQRSRSQIRLPLLPVPITMRAPSTGSMFSFSAWSGTAPRASTLKSANWRLPLLCTLNGLGVLCKGICYCRFAILSCALNGVSFGPYFLRTKLFVGHGGGVIRRGRQPMPCTHGHNKHGPYASILLLSALVKGGEGHATTFVNYLFPVLGNGKVARAPYAKVSTLDHSGSPPPQRE